MLQKTYSIAIIGGGASATILYANLVKSGLNFKADIYDREGRFGKGIAYSTGRMCHLLNVRASNMSAFMDDKDHFVRWAESYGYNAKDFVPRKLYGEYLCALLDKNANFIASDVISCEAVSNGYEIDGKIYDIAVLASGNVVSLSPALNNPPDYYYHNPWELPDNLKSAKSVALIGSGLTAVDAILSLQDMGFKGQVTIFSRHGLFPMEHSDPQIWNALGIKPGFSPLAILKALRTNVEHAREQGISWQAVLDSIRPMTNEIWKNWNETQRRQFQRHLYTFWNIHRHRMAPEIAAKIPKTDIKFIHHRVEAITHDGIKGHNFEAIINCMGYRYHEKNRQYDVAHRIGPSRFGDLFETTAIPEIRAQADEISRKIIKNTLS